MSEFEQGVVYLVPQPDGRFVSLTREIGQHFGLLPFRGEFGEDPVVHLTVAARASPADRRRIIDRLNPELPISLVAVEAWLMVGSNAGGWNVVRKMPLGATARRGGRL
jgi:hypothetical protein